MKTVDRISIVLIGYGRMGRAVERVANEHPDVFTIAGHVPRTVSPAVFTNLCGRGPRVAIDFSSHNTAPASIVAAAEAGLHIVSGTTGMNPAVLDKTIADAAKHGAALIHAPNFSIGQMILREAVRQAATLAGGLPHSFDAWIHERHHAKKTDRPSGTALQLQETIRLAGAECGEASSTRAGHAPGTHTVGFDGRDEEIVFSHTVRNRHVFAVGALECARWLAARRRPPGAYTLHDVVSSPV